MLGEITVRNCNPHDERDAASYEQLKEGAVFAHLLSMPNYEVSENLFFAEADGVIIGYVNVLPELGIGRVVLDYRLSPPCLSENVVIMLVDRALQRAKELGAKAAHMSVPSAVVELTEFLAELEFNEVRIYYELRLDLSQVDLPYVDKPHSAFRRLRLGEEAELAKIQNRCFAGHWGYEPNTAEGVTWRLQVKKNSLEDVILAMDKGEIIGYCWTVVECGHDPLTNKSKGCIYMLGVAPAYRKKDVGKKLLKAGIAHLRSKGREIVDITVDNHNVVAVALYRSFGFQLHGETVWYEKVVN